MTRPLSRGPHRPGPRRFYLTYLRRELRGRMRQAVLVALGLALGVGLVITVTAAAAGVRDAQAAVLHGLYGIGTDMTVTTAPSAKGSKDPGSSAHTLLTGGLGLLRASEVPAISRLRGVTHAAGGLLLTELTAAAVPLTITVDGTDVARLAVGPYSSGTITAGHGFSAAEAAADVAVVDSRYAAASNIAVGSTVTIAGTAFRVTGIIGQSGSTADIYIPLGRAQELSSHAGQVNIIYVATSGTVPVQPEISRILPSATVTSTANLAGAVRGSLGSAASLAADLGRWVAVTALTAACAIASLLTMAAVARRVRDLGTLKALGWPTSRIVAQIIGESVITGACGALAGIALGFAGAALIDAISPKLTATASGTGSSVAVRLTAHAGTGTALSAALLAMGCALVAGAAGGWRAARLQPADAFTEVT